MQPQKVWKFVSPGEVLTGVGEESLTRKKNLLPEKWEQCLVG